MAGSLIGLCDLFFYEYLKNVGSWQFSGNTSTAYTRLEAMRRKQYPTNWAALQRWPVQCTCGHTQEFCVPYLWSTLCCGICKEPFWSVDIAERMKDMSCDRTRWSMLCHHVRGVCALGEIDVQALRAISRIAGDDDGMIAEVARDLDLTRVYRSQA